MKINLYSTVGCHLCEQAKVILWPLLFQYQFQLNEIDIATDDLLIEHYGTRIPVVGVTNHTTELNWPFNAQQVDSFFAELARL